MAISRCFLHFQQLYHDIFQLNIPKISQKTPRSLNVRLSTRITRLPIVAMNDYRHFATGPYSRGDFEHLILGGTKIIWSFGPGHLNYWYPFSLSCVLCLLSTVRHGNNLKSLILVFSSDLVQDWYECSLGKINAITEMNSLFSFTNLEKCPLLTKGS